MTDSKLFGSPCSRCGGRLNKNGITRSGYQQYRCRECAANFTDSPHPRGGQVRGINPDLAKARAARKVAKRREARRLKREQENVHSL